MATSKILYMKDSGKSYHGKHLKAALEYICDLGKTQQGRLISAVNCQPSYAFEQMKGTKKHFGKIDKRQGYHLIISFKEGEVDADTAFEITERFVAEYLQQSYEAVYAVHDNTDHMHSHIIFNSVSFVDGKKYRYQKGDWAKYIQPITNRLCQAYGISTIELENEGVKEEGRQKEWDVYRNGPFVWSDMVKRDVDACIIQSETFEDFLTMMKEKAYEVKQNKYLAVKGAGMSRFIRLKTLGEQYTESRIRERIKKEQLSDYQPETFEEAERIVYTQIPYGKRANLNGLQKRYYAKLYRIGLLKRKPYSQAWKYRKEIREFHKLQEQYLFLVEHQIESREELQIKLKQLEVNRKTISKEKSRVYRAREKCAGLFAVQKQMSEYKICEEEYQRGDAFFGDEHEVWVSLEDKLKEQGYSYQEVEALREHYRKEYARVRVQEAEIRKQLQIAKTILKEEETETKGKKEEKEKKLEKEQPKR